MKHLLLTVLILQVTVTYSVDRKSKLVSVHQPDLQRRQAYFRTTRSIHRFSKTVFSTSRNKAFLVAKSTLTQKKNKDENPGLTPKNDPVLQSPKRRIFIPKPAVPTSGVNSSKSGKELNAEPKPAVPTSGFNLRKSGKVVAEKNTEPKKGELASGSTTGPKSDVPTRGLPSSTLRRFTRPFDKMLFRTRRSVL